MILVGFVVVNIIFISVVKSVDWNFSKAREIAQFNDEKFKVLVFGNSTALDGVNTEMLSSYFGESYNFALGGATLEANYVQLRDYLKSNSKPDRVLFFLSSCHVNYKKLGTINPMIEDKEAPKNVSLKELPLYKFRWLFIENIKKLISSQHRAATLRKGQLQMNKSIADQTVYKGLNIDCLELNNYLGVEFNYFWQMYELCLDKSIDFEIFEMPCWKGSRNECNDIFIKNDKVDSLIVYNLNNRHLADSLLNPTSDWLSENHLNYSGSVKITNKIISILSK